MSKFTVKKSLVEVNLDYIELDDDEIVIVEGIEEKERYKEKIKTARAWFERPSWSNFNKYIKGCVDVDPITGDPYVDTITLRDKKFRNLFKRLVDGNGEEVLLDIDFFNNVIPGFAIALVQGYDEKLDKEKTDILLKDEFVKKIFAERLEEINKSQQGLETQAALPEKEEKAEEKAEKKDEK